MTEIIKKVLFNIERSNEAYIQYASGRKYHQAIHIYKANQAIYALLTEHADLWTENREMIFNYLFHLEDWFEQFDAEVRYRNPSLQSIFTFNRIKNSQAYPVGIHEYIKNLCV